MKALRFVRVKICVKARVTVTMWVRIHFQHTV